jgi:hypothetical protein
MSGSSSASLRAATERYRAHNDSIEAAAPANVSGHDHHALGVLLGKLHDVIEILRECSIDALDRAKVDALQAILMELRSEYETLRARGCVK